MRYSTMAGRGRRPMMAALFVVCAAMAGRAEVVVRYTFDSDSEGWGSASLPPPFTTPTFEASDGALRIAATSNNQSYGTWLSPSDGAAIVEGAMYRATWRVSTDVEDPSMVPTIRLRINTSNYQQYVVFGIESASDGGCSPGPGGKTYETYFTPSQEAAGQTFLFSFDLMNFDPGDAPRGSVALEWLLVERLTPPPPATPTPTSVPSATPTATATSSPSETPVPTPTPLPTPDLTLTLPGGVTLGLMSIPSGTFEMGRYPGEQDSQSNEDPRHTVTIGYGFHMGTTEVTQAQWLAVMGDWPGSEPSSLNGVGDQYPAYNVSWNDIVGSGGFLETLNAHLDATGQGVTVRLPSESEWEYCCRAGTATRFYFGDSLGCEGGCEDCAAGALPGNRSDYMWYCGNNGDWGDPDYGTKPVAGKLPNAWGLYDMSGNVYEWCQDDWHSSYTGAPTDGSPWGDGTASSRVYRGGIWYDYAQFSRSAYRSWGIPSYRYDFAGFRLAAGH